MSISTLKRVSAPELRSLLLSPQASSVAVIDVRDADHVGGHIRSSHHYPSSTLDVRLPELVRKMADMPIVVFHCALSQQRGPGAALRYSRERRRRIEKGEINARTNPGVKNGKGEERGGKEEVDGMEEKWIESEEDRGIKDDEAGNGVKEQEVYVLDQGFVGWQRLYGTDERLTEAYAADVWVDY